MRHSCSLSSAAWALRCPVHCLPRSREESKISCMQYPCLGNRHFQTYDDIQYVLKIYGFLNERAGTGSKRQQLSIQIRWNVVAVLLCQFCNSQSDSVISCSGNNNEKRPIMFCRDSKRVCNCIMHLLITGKKPLGYSESIVRSFQNRKFVAAVGGPERHAIVRHLNPCKKLYAIDRWGP